MTTAPAARAIVERALAYPFAPPRGSYLLDGGRAVALADAAPDTQPPPLLAYGANASPQALAHKLGDRAAEARIPVVAARLEGFDVVYSAHISPYGAIPGTLQPCAGAVAHVHAIRPSPQDAAILDATEPNYVLARLDGIALRLETGERLESIRAYVSRHGCLGEAGEPVGVAAVPVEGRRWPALDEPAVLALARDRLGGPDGDLAAFVLEQAADAGVATRRTAALRAGAIPFAWGRWEPVGPRARSPR
jgi:hypothetical protein